MTNQSPWLILLKQWTFIAEGMSLGILTFSPSLVYKDDRTTLANTLGLKIEKMFKDGQIDAADHKKMLGAISVLTKDQFQYTIQGAVNIATFCAHMAIKE